MADIIDNPAFNPGAGATNALQNFLMQQAAMKAQQQESQLAVNRDRREQQRFIIEQEDKEKANVAKQIAGMMPGDIPPPELVAAAKKHGVPLPVAPQAAGSQFMQPGMGLEMGKNPVTGQPELPTGEVQPGGYKGTPEQQGAIQLGRMMSQQPNATPNQQMMGAALRVGQSKAIEPYLASQERVEAMKEGAKERAATASEATAQRAATAAEAEAGRNERAKQAEADRKDRQREHEDFLKMMKTVAAKPASELNDDDMLPAAVQYNALGNKALMGFGMSKDVREKIIHIAGKIRRGEIGVPADTPNFALAAADYEAATRSLDFQKKFATQAKTAAKTADANLDLVLKASPKVTRTDSKWINKHVQAFLKGATAMPDLTDFETKVYTAVREYAKVASGSSASVAGLSDTATKEAEKLLSASKSPKDLEAAIEAMRADMGNIISNLDQSQEFLRKQIGDQGKSTTTGAGGATSSFDDLLKKYGAK